MRLIRPSLFIACKEFKECTRGLWLLVGSLLFGLLSLAAVFGSSAIGGDFSFRPADLVFHSLVMLSVFLVPLLAILIAYDAFAGESENGTLILLMTYPMPRSALILGKLLGQGSALGLSLAIGFSVPAVLTLAGVLPYESGQILKLTLKLVFSSWLLGLFFILVSYFVSLLCSHKASALGILLFIWFVLVLLYDLALLVMTIAFEGVIDNALVQWCVLLNPTSVFRLLNQGAEAGGQINEQMSQLGVYFGLCLAIFWVADTVILKRKSF